MNKLKILCVAFLAPPLHDAQSLSCLKTLKGLAEKNLEIKVISRFAENPGQLSLNNLIPCTVDFIRIPYKDHPLWVRRILYRLFPFFILTPDIYKNWIKRVVPYASKLILEWKPDILYTRSQPFTDHLIGYELKKQFPDLPWIVYMSDPLVDNPYYYLNFIKFHRYYNRHIEKNVFESADEIHFVSEETKTAASKRYEPLISRKFLCIPHGYDPGLYGNNTPKPSKSPLKLVYAGGFIAERNPMIFLKSLAKLNSEDITLPEKLKVEFIGKTQPKYILYIKKLGLDKIVHFTQNQPFPDILKTICNADILLLIDADFKGYNIFFPSKLVDYLGSGRPIFGLTPDDSTSARILDKLNQPHVPPNDQTQIYNKLKEILLSLPPSYAPPDEYNINRVCDRIEKRFRYFAERI